MAKSLTTRFGLQRWTDDLDTQDRAEFDDAHAAIEEKAAGYLEGTTAARPAASALLARFDYYDREQGRRYTCVDTDGAGAWAWVETLTRDAGNAAYEALVSRAGASAGEVPTLQGDGTLAFAAGGGGAAVVRKTADQSITSTTAPVNDTHLTFPVAANESWTFVVAMSVVTAATGVHCKVTMAGPAGSTIAWSIAGAHHDPAGAMSVPRVFAAGSTRSHYADTSPTRITLIGTVVNGATAGNVTVQWAQDTSSANALTVQANSHLVAQKVA